MWKGGEVKKTKRLTHEEIKKQLIELIAISDVAETDELNKKAAEVIKQYETSVGPRRKL